jgi:glycosyltransferase involved in cell wall biosynthesis
MSTTQPRLLFFCDFPPSNLAGGAILVKRLLADYPSERVTILTGSHFQKHSPEIDRLKCRHAVFPTTNETGRWGLGRLKFLLDWLLIPVLALTGVWLIKRRDLKVILTIAHGHFFIAAALASLMTSAPLVLIVHDDWVSWLEKTSYVMKGLYAPLFKFALRSSAHIFAVSPGMQKLLREEFQVDSELQLPSTESHQSAQPSQSIQSHPRTFRIMYAGIGSGVVVEGLDLIVQTIKSGKLRALGLESCELHLYITSTEEEIRRLGWDHEAVKIHGWVSQQELRKALALADALFLPYSFSEEQRYFTTSSFPSKSADYLASGKPMLILSPPYSSIVEYAQRYKFAEVVDRPSEEFLAQGIYELWSNQEHYTKLCRNAIKTFNLNHNIEAQRISFQQLVSRLSARASNSNKGREILSDIHLN